MKVFAIYIGLIALIGIGYVKNVLALVAAGPITEWAAVEVIRCIGLVVAPLGAIMGYFA